MKLEFGDMIFYSIAGLVVILLFWFRFVEAHVGLWGAWLVWIGWSVVLLSRYLRGRADGRSV